MRKVTRNSEKEVSNDPLDHLSTELVTTPFVPFMFTVEFTESAFHLYKDEEDVPFYSLNASFPINYVGFTYHEAINAFFFDCPIHGNDNNLNIYVNVFNN